MRILYKIYIYLSIPVLWTLRLLEILSATLLKALSLPHMNPEHASIFWPLPKNHFRPYYGEIPPVVDSSTGKCNTVVALAALLAVFFILLSRKYTATLASNQHYLAQYNNLRRSGKRAALHFSLKIAELNNVVRAQIPQIHQVRAHIFTMQEDLAVQKRAKEGYRLQQDQLLRYLRGVQQRFRISERTARDDSERHAAREQELLEEVNAGKAKIAELEEILRLKGGLVEEHVQGMASMKGHLHETERDLDNAIQDIAGRDEHIEALEKELATKTRTTFRERVDDRAEMGDLRREIEGLNRDLKDVRQRSESFEQERNDLRTQLDDAEAKFAALKIKHTEMGEKLNDLVDLQEIQDDALRQENAQLVKDIKAFHQQVNLTLLAQAVRSLDALATDKQPAEPTAFEQDVTLRDDAELRKMLQELQDDLARTNSPLEKVKVSADIVIAEEVDGDKEVHGFGSSGECVSGESSRVSPSWASDVELAESNGGMDSVGEDTDSGPVQEVPKLATTPSSTATQVTVGVEPTQDVGITTDEPALSSEAVKEEKPKSFRDAVTQQASSEEQNQIPSGRGRNLGGARVYRKSFGARPRVGNHALSTNRGARIAGPSSSQPNWRRSMAPRTG